MSLWASVPHYVASGDRRGHGEGSADGAGNGGAIGKQVVTHAVRTWFSARRERAQRGAELIELVRIGVPDHFKQRKLVRQLEDLADQIAERLRPVYEHEFRDLPEGERAAALQAVVDALEGADLTDATLFAVDVDARKLARLVRQRVPVRRVGLAEPAERLYDAVLDESCMALVQVVKHLPAFEPRALAELLGRFSHVVDGIAEVLHRLPRTTLDAPQGSERDEEFRARYLMHVSETLDELEQFGIDVRRYRPRTLVSVAYLSLQVSTDPRRRGHGNLPDERWFADGRRTAPGSSSLRAEAALAEGRRTLLRGDAGSGKKTLLQWLAVTAARSGFSGPLVDWNGCRSCSGSAATPTARCRGPSSCSPGSPTRSSTCCRPGGRTGSSAPAGRCCSSTAWTSWSPRSGRLSGRGCGVCSPSTRSCGWW